MRMIRTAGQSEEYAKRVPDSNGVYIVPAFAGMGAPYWNPYARGTIVGLTRGCKKEHFIRATLESIAYQAKDVIHAMEEDAGVTLNGLRVDGGASANNMLVQFQADIIDAAVLRPDVLRQQHSERHIWQDLRQVTGKTGMKFGKTGSWDEGLNR